MDIRALLNDKTKKAIEKRELLAQALRDGEISVVDFLLLGRLDDKSQGVVLEAMESVTGKQPALAGEDWLDYAVGFIDADANSLKREASRVVGNLAHMFAESTHWTETAVEKLLANTANSGTVVRWGSAYALGRIIQIPRLAESGLFVALTAVCDYEQDSGVKKQYESGLKKARKIRGLEP